MPETDRGLLKRTGLKLIETQGLAEGLLYFCAIISIHCPYPFIKLWLKLWYLLYFQEREGKVCANNWDEVIQRKEQCPLPKDWGGSIKGDQ